MVVLPHRVRTRRSASAARMADRQARSTTEAMRASPLTAAANGWSAARTRNRPCNPTMVVWATADSPSDGSTSEMYRRNTGLGPMTNTPSRCSSTRCS